MEITCPKILLPIKERSGKCYQSKNFGVIKIIEYFTSRNCTIQFEDGTILKDVNYYSILKGGATNPNQPSVYDKGYLGIGKYSQSDNKKLRSIWNSILTRCYNTNQELKYLAYKDVSVCEEWHNFQNFAEWFYKNYNPETMQDWHLDKDVLVRGNKIYSPETCCFIPAEINTCFAINRIKGEYPTGVCKANSKEVKYKAQINIDGKRTYLGAFNTVEEAFISYRDAKIKEFKKLANKWRGKIPEEVYEALINYRVEITD